jgi:hypothetical protein
VSVKRKSTNLTSLSFTIFNTSAAVFDIKISRKVAEIEILARNQGLPVADSAPENDRHTGGLATGTRGGMVADSMPLTYFGASKLPQIVHGKTLNQNKALTIEQPKRHRCRR